MPPPMRTPSKPVAFRLEKSQHQKLAAQAHDLGVSPGGLAREMVLEQLGARERGTTSLADVAKLVQALRSDLATATEATTEAILVKT